MTISSAIAASRLSTTLSIVLEYLRCESLRRTRRLLRLFPPKVYARLIEPQGRRVIKRDDEIRLARFDGLLAHCAVDTALTGTAHDVP